MDEPAPGAAPVEGQAADGGTPPPAGGAPAPAPVWTEGFSEDIKGYVDNKGFKDAGSLASAYQNLEKLQGTPADQLLKFPNDPNVEGAMDPIFAKMGRPEDATKYTNVLGDGFDKPTFDKIAETAHALGLGDGQFQGLQTIMQEQSASMLEAQETENTTTFDTWKAANPDGFNDAARVMSAVGMTEETVAKMLSGDKSAIYDFAAKVGAKTSESDVILGNDPNGGFGGSTEAAKSKIAELMGDSDFMKRYTSASKLVRDPALAQMSKLHEAANKT